jgi:hypothetical protein
MPRKCTICGHDDRQALDTALVNNKPLRGIARTFRVSADALARHRDKHLPATLAQAKAAEDVADADDLVSRLQALSQETLAIFREARQAKEHDLALRAIARAEKQIELLAKLLGELDERPTINLVLSAEWVAVRTVIMTALQPYADARISVADALMALEQRNGTGSGCDA